METKAQITLTEFFCRNLGFRKFVVVEAEGNVEGLALMWKEEINILLEWENSRIIYCHLKGLKPSTNWMLYSCYGPPTLETGLFLNSLYDSIFYDSNPWLIIGDLNKLVDDSEKFGGRRIARKKSFLTNFINKARGIDLGFSGRCYTWENKHDTTSLIKKNV